MASWITCTIPSGEKIVLNCENITMIHRNDHTNTTQVDFVTPGKTVIVKETVDELKTLGLPL